MRWVLALVCCVWLLVMGDVHGQWTYWKQVTGGDIPVSIEIGSATLSAMALAYLVRTALEVEK